VGLRKVLSRACLAAKLDKSKRQDWSFKLLSLSLKATKSGSKFFSLGYFVLNGKFGGDSPVVLKTLFSMATRGVHSEKNGWKILFFWLFSTETKRWGWWDAYGKMKPSTYNRKWSMKVLKKNSYFTIGEHLVNIHQNGVTQCNWVPHLRGNWNLI
jgi:hypothetical protein